MVSPHQEELTALARDVYETLTREDAEKSFHKTGRTVIKTTAHRVQINSILGVKPMEYLKNRGEY